MSGTVTTNEIPRESVLGAGQPRLPLLGKELAEQAARRRTYFVRVLYAALLFGVFLLRTNQYFSEEAIAAADADLFGRYMFDYLVAMQFAGVLLFLPAMMSGVLAYEKERQSMALLLLTDMRPREILFQKYLSRLVPMVSFILLSLPLLAFCYAFGGLTTDRLLGGVIALLSTCLQIGALALLCSAFASTSAGALIASYVLTAVLYLGWPYFLMWCTDWTGTERDVAFSHVPIYAFGPLYHGGRKDLSDALANQVVPLLVTCLFLGLARVFLIRRAFATPRNLAVALLRWIDKVFDRANAALGGVRLGKEGEHKLPGDRPVAWREVARRSLGRPVYLVRIALLLEVPVILAAGGALSGSEPSEWTQALSIWLMILWALAALAVAVLSAGAIASERASQTLEVLLSTPILGREIVADKLRSVRRLIRVLFVPFLSTILLKALWMGAFGVSRSSTTGYGQVLPDWPWVYAVHASLAVAVFLPLVAWLSAFVALRVRTRLRAILTILLILVFWNAVPLFLLPLIEPPWQPGYRDAGFFYLWVILHWLTPSTAISMLEKGFPTSDTESAIAWLWVALLAYGVATFILRHLCTAHADAYLGRPGQRDSL